MYIDWRACESFLLFICYIFGNDCVAVLDTKMLVEWYAYPPSKEELGT